MCDSQELTLPEWSAYKTKQQANYLVLFFVTPTTTTTNDSRQKILYERHLGHFVSDENEN